jgi:type IV fimbrial biogenesis protein FimT
MDPTRQQLLGDQEGRIVLSGRRRRSGFTLIELLVGMTILAIVLGLGAPAMGTYLQNSKLAAATASLYAGVQAARTEAIRRNIQAQFVLTDLPLTAGDPATANDPALATPNGRGWVVRATKPPPAVPGTFELVDKKSSSEGEGSAVAPSIVVNCALPAGCVGAIPFNGFGGTADGQTYRINISNPAAGACGAVRCRSITVSPGGQIAACDSTIPLPSGDSRACPF